MSAAQAKPQAAQKSLPKVLRIGIVQEGKIAQERLIRHGETVTVGESPRNTFVVTGTQLGARHEIFVYSGHAYALNVPEWVEGKIQWKEGIRGLEDLRSKNEMQKRGDAWQLPLTENVRGKVSLGGTTLLFQFVPAPPEPVRAVSAADFRPRMLDEDDPLFLGLLGVFTVVAAAFMLYVWVTPLPERIDLDAVENAVDILVDKEDVIELPDPTQVPDAPAAEEKPVEKPAEKPVEKPSGEPAPEKDAPPPPDAESVKKKSLLLQMIGTTGNASGDAVADVLGDEGAAMAGLDNALNGVSGVQTANASNVGIKGGGAGGKGDAKVGIDTSTGGESGTGTGSVKVKRAVVDGGEADATADEGDPSGISAIVRKNNGRVISCLDQSLKINPDVNGRVSVGWTIQAGKVTESHVVQNTTGDDNLGQCIAKAVRGFRFDPGLTAEVSSYPWALSGQ